MKLITSSKSWTERAKKEQKKANVQCKTKTLMAEASVAGETIGQENSNKDYLIVSTILNWVWK